MESSLRNCLSLPTLMFFFLFLNLVVLPSSLLARKHPLHDSHISYHNGPLLTGNVELSILWYGVFEDFEKAAINTFIESLNNERNVSFEPNVAQWWNKVESYQLLAKKDLKTKIAPEIKVKVVKQVEDRDYSMGKLLSSDSYPHLVKKASDGAPPSAVAVIFTNQFVELEDLCSGPCYNHGVGGLNGKQLYIVVGNPGGKCPAARCYWPFEKADGSVAILPVEAATGTDTDSKIIHFAAALAGTVTNPYSTGFFEEEDHPKLGQAEAGSKCFGIFGSGAFPGYTGRIRVDPHTGGSFNAHGLNGSRFLLPALWDPKNSACWTTV